MKRFLQLIFITLILFSCSQNTSSESEKTKEYNIDEIMNLIQSKKASFEGTLPCQFCDSISINMQLNTDSSFQLTQSYHGIEKESEFYNGTWFIDSNVLILKCAEFDLLLRIENDKLQMIDDEGFDVYNEKGYTLKSSTKNLSNTFKGKYFYMADSAIFTLCLNNKTYPILTNEFSFQLEKKFLESETQELYIELEGSIQLLKNDDGIEVNYLVIENILHFFETCP